MTKKKLAQECRDMLTLSYSDGGVSSYNEYNQFLCDNAPEMLKFMSIEGLLWLKRRMQELRKDMPEADRV